MSKLNVVPVLCLLSILFFPVWVQAGPGNRFEQLQNQIDPLENLNPLMAFDPAWRPGEKSPFARKGNRFELGMRIGSARRILFPQVLNAQTPIVIQTRNGEVKQFLDSEDTYQAHLAGRYLVYRGRKNSILYRYDKEKQSLREFVYLAKPSDQPENGEVIQWRFEGVDLTLRPDGSVALTKTQDIKADVRKISNNTMADRISHFLAKRRGASLKEGPVTKTLFVIPAPEYIDGNKKYHKAGVRYTVQDQKITLHLQTQDKQVYPLWVDPTLTADAHADLILNGQGAGDEFGESVASAGDFNGDGMADVIVGAPKDDNSGDRSGSAFIFFGGQTGTINNPDTNADVVLNGQGAGDQFGDSVASAGDFNGDGMDDVIVGAWRRDSGSVYIFFGGQTGTINNPDTNADVVLNGQGALDHFGYSVASAGDFNGDGLDDVIVGARMDDNNGLTDSGSAFIFFGGQTGTINNPDTNADVVLNGQGVFDHFGWSVASAGDFNGDGLDDVIVGAYDNSSTTSGSAFIFLGGQTGTLNNPDTNADVVLKNAPGIFDEFGWSVASAGDFNGDGLDDVIVGAPRDDNNGLTDSGSAFVLFGVPGETDSDGDGVLDEADACLMTPPGAIVNTEGCSIDDLCLCENDWKNHSAYVKCVRQASKDFVKDGLISRIEKRSIVSMARQSSCGR
jgi:FG-GAP repeat